VKIKSGLRGRGWFLSTRIQKRAGTLQKTEIKKREEKNWNWGYCQREFLLVMRKMCGTEVHPQMPRRKKESSTTKEAKNPHYWAVYLITVTKNWVKRDYH